MTITQIFECEDLKVLNHELLNLHTTKGVIFKELLLINKNTSLYIDKKTELFKLNEMYDIVKKRINTLENSSNDYNFKMICKKQLPKEMYKKINEMSYLKLSESNKLQLKFDFNTNEL